MSDAKPYVYETEALGMGDPLRVALSGLQRNLEAFLFDQRDPGYANPDFLSWALEHSKLTAAATGTPANTLGRWDPSFVDNREDSIDSAPDSDNGNRFYDGVVRARKVDFGTDHKHDNSYGPMGEHEVTNPAYARLTNDNAVVVPAHREDEAPEPAKPEPAKPKAADKKGDN